MRHLFYCVCSLLLSLPGYSQFSTGPSLFIQNGVTFSVDSLVLIPNTNTTLSNNTLTHNNTVVPGNTPGTNSIARLYAWGSPITYNGEVGIVYDDAELAGNTEAMLQIAFRNGPWTTTATSTVNPGTNYVNYQATNVTFNMVTATSAGVALPITYTGFSAAVKEQYVLLSWMMHEMDNLHGFEIAFSNDGRHWTTASTLTAPAGKRDYSFQHNDLNFTIRYYRVAMLDYNGDRTYTRMVVVRNNNMGAGMRIVRNGGSTLLFFNGAVPASVQVYDMKGQLVVARNVVQQQCEITGLIPGTYVIYYVTDGQKISRKVQF